MWKALHAGGPKIRGSAVVRLPHSPIAKLEMETRGTPVHSMMVWSVTLNWEVYAGSDGASQDGAAGDGGGGGWSLELSRAASDDEFESLAVLFATRAEIVEGRVSAAGEGLIWSSKRVAGWEWWGFVEAETEAEVE